MLKWISKIVFAPANGLFLLSLILSSISMSLTLTPASYDGSSKYAGFVIPE